MPTLTVTGTPAIRYAAAAGTLVSKYADPTTGARDDLTVDEAEQVAFEDPGLVYVEIDRGQVEALRREAASAGDDQQVQHCDDALGGDREALTNCVDALVDALNADIEG